MIKTQLRGLYAITDASETRQEKILRDVEAALRGGARIIQYRAKHGDASSQEHTARALLAMAIQCGAVFIINDYVHLAKRIGAHGVHLGQDDITLAEARATLGPDAIIGVSCYNRFELAQAAAQAGADYVAFGRFFASRTKPTAVQAGLDLLQRAKRELSIPVVAIGGITQTNAQPLIEAGVDMVAVVEGIFGQEDVAKAARHIQSLFLSDEPGITR